MMRKETNKTKEITGFKLKKLHMFVWKFIKKKKTIYFSDNVTLKQKMQNNI